VPGPSSDEAERRLRDLPNFKILGLLHGASNYTFLAQLGPDGPRVVYKPARGESPLWDFEAGTLYQREVAAYELSKALGWPAIPPTVVRRKAPHGVGALQLFIDADSRHFLGESSKHPATWVRVALFDVLTNNADRKSGHCLFDADDNVWVIDHGLTFHVDPKLRTVIWEFAGDPLPDDLCGDVERVLGQLERGKLARAMEELISDEEMRVLRRRFRGVLDRRWRFPEPSSAWSIPWPPV
jgi:hypothetical protein